MCSKFNRQELIIIIFYLVNILLDRDPEVKPRDHFKEQHPNYRDFYVDPLAPLTKPPKQLPTLSFKQLLKEYRNEHGKELKPVRRRSKCCVPAHTKCPHCSAPLQYLYLNNGRENSQILCKVCNNLSSLNTRQLKTKYWCPHCGYALYRWKDSEMVTKYKCDNDRCPAYLKALEKLNPKERKLQKERPSQFKLRYQFQEYHFTRKEIMPSMPDPPKVDLARVFNPDNIVGLALTFHVSFGLAARKTALIMKQVFNHDISYQTVLNYAEAAAYYCHDFNQRYKGDIDDTSVGDETYIKIQGDHAYTFLALSPKPHKISAYEVSWFRDVLPATRTINEAVRTAGKDQQITFISDGNPAYPAAIHFLNLESKEGEKIMHKKVIGLQNLDDESETFRPFKQLIERLNRTYKYHTRSASGFKNRNGAMVLTILFVTHYNFLRPHWALQGKVPIPLDELKGIPTIQAKWCKILDIAMKAA
jgi:transposase-like protein